MEKRRLRPSIRNTLVAGGLAATGSLLGDSTAQDTVLKINDRMVGSGQHEYSHEYVTIGDAVPFGEMVQNAGDFGLKGMAIYAGAHFAVKGAKKIGPKIHAALGKQWPR
jgi:hypothetical protein